MFFLRSEAGLSMAVDNCPERMNAAALRPPRIETAVESWSGMGVETAVEETMLSLETAVDTCVG